MKNLWKKGSLFRKYYLLLIAVILAYLVAVSIVLITFIAVHWWNEKTDLLIENANYIVSVADDMYKDTDEKSLGSLMTNTLRLISNATESDYFVADASGEIIACKEDYGIKRVKSCKEHKSISIPESYMKRALNNGFSDYSTDEVFGLGRFVVAVPINIEGKLEGAIFAVEDAITGLVPYMISVSQVFLYTFLIVLVSSFVILYVLTKKITVPINEMKEVTNHFAKGEFEYRANEDYKEQYLSEFAKSLNKMAYELSIEDEAQKSFVANVSHELKTPMTTIGGFIDGILDGTIPREKENEYLSIVSNEVKRLSRLVVSMLNLSKIESGEVGILPSRYDVTAQIFETLLSFEKRINEKQIQIEGFEEMGNVIINADRDLLQQVIYNLFDNAVKFTPQGGKIIISAESIDEVSYVSIKNTCKAISDEEISRLFERFYKVDKSRSFDVKGVGLGLYIVKTIINMHGGEINAKSIDGEYIEFRFSIPQDLDE